MHIVELNWIVFCPSIDSGFMNIHKGVLNAEECQTSEVWMEEEWERRKVSVGEDEVSSALCRTSLLLSVFTCQASGNVIQTGGEKCISFSPPGSSLFGYFEQSLDKWFDLKKKKRPLPPLH